MSHQYLFPCNCGKNNEVETAQAGQTIECSGCGAELELPSLLKIKQLEPATTDAAKPVSQKIGRSYQQSVVMTIGMALFLLGGIAAGVLFYFTNQFYAERPQITNESREGFRKMIDARPLAQNVDFWDNEIKKHGPEEWKPHPYITGEILSNQFRLFAYISSGFATIGVLLIASTFFMRSQPKKRRVKKRNVDPDSDHESIKGGS